jgi:hypothetical protein
LILMSAWKLVRSGTDIDGDDATDRYIILPPTSVTEW